MDNLESLSAYNIVNSQEILSLLNARPLVFPFQNLATSTPAGETQSAIITIGANPFVLNQIQLGTNSLLGNSGAYPNQFWLQWNMYDADNLGLFRGGTSPRASTVFGSPIQIEYAIQPVKVFPPRTRMKLEWTNTNSTSPYAFEMFFMGIEVLSLDPAKTKTTSDMQDALEELLYEKRVR